MFIKQIVTLALASSALAQMTDMSGMGHTEAEQTTTTPTDTAAESENTSQTPLIASYPSGFANSSTSTAMGTDTTVPTSVVDPTMPPASSEPTTEVTSVPTDYTLSTSVVPDTTTTPGMPHESGYVMPNSTATGSPEPPISGSSVSSVSVSRTS